MLDKLWGWNCMDDGGWPSESRNARRAREFLRLFTVAMGAVTGHSVSDPVGVGGSAVLGAGRGGGGTDKRWPPPTARAIENVPTWWGFEFVVATLYTLLDVLVRFDATCRLVMMLGSVFCDWKEERLGERSGSCKGNTPFCRGCWGTANMGTSESS